MAILKKIQPNFICNVSNIVGASNVVNNSYKHNSAKRKGAQHTTSQYKKNGTRIGTHCLDQLVKVFRWIQSAHQLLDIKKDVALKRLWKNYIL